MTRSSVIGALSFELWSVVATVDLPVSGVVVLVVVVTSFFSTSAGLSSLVEAQPATTTTLARASNIFPEFLII